ncbi:hypothetical protein EI427_18125 [Flammeovirga pectinis]|uniref:VanZ-like domain-containing protein n=1 Tax=Flammeovirga pectinis TaxID=2494373 RepID=A0A3Q9FR30_9BACT|nr:hypothetical protein [Flammeovirga pectinis]AZQ64076.1 hypothetical protein EI427_18125 [Flammeovirga pectinis]
MKFKSYYFFFFILFFSIAFILNNYYRPYIYTNNINDFGLADMASNLFFIPIGCVFFWMLSKTMTKKTKELDVIISFVLLSLHEALSYFIPFLGVFDFKDILALFIGAVIAFYIQKNTTTNALKHS